MRPLVLASASARRLELLCRAGLVPDRVVAARLEEGAAEGELAGALARRLAESKAEAVSKSHRRAFVLGADTVVAVGRRILAKPTDEAEARRCLELLSGRRHRVLTAIAVVTPEGGRGARLVTTAVAFKRLDEAEIAWYLGTEEWRGKAGGYAIQGRASRFVSWLAGSYSNVVGLPVFETVRLLDGLGYRVLGPGRRNRGSDAG